MFLSVFCCLVWANRYSFIGSPLEQFLNECFYSNNTVAHLEASIQSSRDYFGKLLVNTFGATSLTTDAYGVCRRAEDAFHLPSPALPAAASAFPNLSFVCFGPTVGFIGAMRSEGPLAWPSSCCIHVCVFGRGRKEVLGRSKALRSQVAVNTWKTTVVSLVAYNQVWAGRM